jgi:hypothetical protein
MTAVIVHVTNLTPGGDDTAVIVRVTNLTPGVTTAVIVHVTNLTPGSDDLNRYRPCNQSDTRE